MFVEEKAKGEVKELDAASQLLLAAAAMIERRGLPDCARDNLGRGCVILTLSELGKTEDCYEAMHRLSTSMDGGWASLPRWSDKAGAEGRGAEVIAKLRAVAFSSPKLTMGSSIEERGWKVKVPSPLGRMHAILRHKGFKPHIEDTEMGDCEVWERP